MESKKKSKQGMEERDPGSVNSLAASASEQRTSHQYPIRQFYLWQLVSRIAIAFHAKKTRHGWHVCGWDSTNLDACPNIETLLARFLLVRDIARAAALLILA